jgi:hypothetical protein
MQTAFEFLMSPSGHFRPFNNICVTSAFRPIATKLLHYGERRDGPIGDVDQVCM